VVGLPGAVYACVSVPVSALGTDYVVWHQGKYYANREGDYAIPACVRVDRVRVTETSSSWAECAGS